ncbi:MAG: hypothetical protein WBI07_03380 [Mobilitalea sp.]
MKIGKELMSKGIVLLGMLMLGLFVLPTHSAYASGPVSISKIDYANENMYVTNNGNAKIYFATEIDASKGRWDVLLADTGTTTEIDFSWLTDTADNILKIKGDVDSTQVTVSIPQKIRKLDISISYSNLNMLAPTDTIASLLNVMTTEGTASSPVGYSDLEWKKGEDGNWRDSSFLTIHQLEKYLIKGTNLYFRIKAIDNVRRASSETKLKIAKTTAPVVVGIDGTKFTAAIKYGKEYRIKTMVGTVESTSAWIQVTDRSITSIPLATILDAAAAYTTKDGTIASLSFPAMTLQIREYATSKKAASKITEQKLNAQRTLQGKIKEEKVPVSTIPDYNIYVGYNGIKNITVTIPSASTEVPYEYAVVKTGTLNMATTVWTSITKNTVTKILAAKAVQDGTLYVRMKEIKSKEATSSTLATAYALASTYDSFKINYPSIPVMPKSTFTYTKGYSTSIVFDVQLNTVGKNPFENSIKNIKLGTKALDYTFVIAPVMATPLDINKVYTMTITLNNIRTGTSVGTPLEELANCFGKAVTINYANGTVDKTSLKLTVQKPTEAASLTASIAKDATTSVITVTTATAAATGNKMIYVYSPAAVTGKYIQDTMTAGTAFVSGDALVSPVAGQYVTIYEVTNDAKNNIVKYKSILIP